MCVKGPTAETHPIRLSTTIVLSVDSSLESPAFALLVFFLWRKLAVSTFLLLLGMMVIVMRSCVYDYVISLKILMLDKKVLLLNYFLSEEIRYLIYLY